MRFHAKYVDASEDGDYYSVSFDTVPPEDESLDPRGPDKPYLIIQRQFESADYGKCYIEMHDYDYAGHYRLRVIEFSPTRLALEIKRKGNNRVEVSFVLNPTEFKEIQRIMNIIVKGDC